MTCLHSIIPFLSWHRIRIRSSWSLCPIRVLRGITHKQATDESIVYKPSSQKWWPQLSSLSLSRWWPLPSSWTHCKWWSQHNVTGQALMLTLPDVLSPITVRCQNPPKKFWPDSLSLFPDSTPDSSTPPVYPPESPIISPTALSSLSLSPLTLSLSFNLCRPLFPTQMMPVPPWLLSTT